MNAKRLLGWVTAGVVGLSVASVVAGSAVFAQRGERNRGYRDRRPGASTPDASWSEIDRRPDLDTRSRPGFYVWRQGNDVFVVANDRNRSRTSHYSGEISAQGDDGRLENVGGYETERDDSYGRVGDSRVRFSFHTGDGLDGVRFRVNRGRRLVLNLRADEPGRERVYLGQYKVPEQGNPLVIVK